MNAIKIAITVTAMSQMDFVPMDVKLDIGETNVTEVKIVFWVLSVKHKTRQ